MVTNFSCRRANTSISRFKLGCSQLIGLKEHKTPVLMKKPSITPPESITNQLVPRPITEVNLEDGFCYKYVINAFCLFAHQFFVGIWPVLYTLI